MSFQVFWIGLWHAFPMLWVSVISDNKVYVWLTAIGTAIAAVTTGNSAYNGIDLFFVAIGTFVALGRIKSNN